MSESNLNFQMQNNSNLLTRGGIGNISHNSWQKSLNPVPKYLKLFPFLSLRVHLKITEKKEFKISRGLKLNLSTGCTND